MSDTTQRALINWPRFRESAPIEPAELLRACEEFQDALKKILDESNLENDSMFPVPQHVLRDVYEVLGRLIPGIPRGNALYLRNSRLQQPTSPLQDAPLNESTAGRQPTPKENPLCAQNPDAGETGAGPSGVEETGV